MSNTHKQVKSMIKNFYPFAKKRYGFDKPAKIVLSDDTQNSVKPLGKTAYYDPQNYSVTVYTHNRHPKDIMRSVAHELVHHTQNCRGDLSNVAGEQGQGYAQNNDHLREMEREAYEQGNLCFRDWEDGIKSNVEPGTIYEKRDKTMGNVNDHFEPRKAALLEKVMDKFGYKVPVQEEHGEWYSDEDETYADMLFRTNKEADEKEEDEYSDIEGKLTHNPFADQLQAEDKKYKRDDDEPQGDLTPAQKKLDLDIKVLPGSQGYGEQEYRDSTRAGKKDDDVSDEAEEEKNEAKTTTIDPEGDEEETEEETVALTHKTSGKEIVVTKASAKEKRKSGNWNEAKTTTGGPEGDKKKTEEETVTLTHKTSGKEIVVTKASAEKKKKSGEWNEAQLKEALRSVFKKNPAFVEIAKKVGVKKLAERLNLRQEEYSEDDDYPEMDPDEFEVSADPAADYDKDYPEMDPDEFEEMNETADFIGHHAEIDGKIYVDSNFLNSTRQIRDTFPSSLESMGFGEFYLKTPKGRIDFDRTRGKEFYGMVGRSHQLYSDPPELADELIAAMEQAEASETPQPSEEPPSDLPPNLEGRVAEGEGDQFEEGDQVEIKDGGFDDGSKGTVIEPMAGGAIVELADGKRVKVDTKDLKKAFEGDPTVMKHEEIGPLTPKQIDEIARKVAKKLIEGSKYKKNDEEEVNEFLSDKINKNIKKANKKSADSAETLKSLEKDKKKKDDDKEEGEEDELKTEDRDSEEEEELIKVKESGASCGGEAAVTLKVDTDGDEPDDVPGDGLEPVEDNPFGDPLQEWWDIRNNNRTERFFKWAIPNKK